MSFGIFQSEHAKLMATKLDIICGRIIEGCWLVALIVAPLFFNVFSNSTFELDKVAAVRSIALIMMLAWIIKGIEKWGMSAKSEERRAKSDVAQITRHMTKKLWRLVEENRLPVMAILFLTAYSLATITSIAPRISLWGSYKRLDGLYTTGAYLVIFFSVLALLRTKKQIDRLITAVLLGSLPVSLYGILQHFGFDPLQWDWDVSQRVASTMGNPIFLAAFLIMTVPLTLCRLCDVWRKAKGDGRQTSPRQAAEQAPFASRPSPLASHSSPLALHSSLFTLRSSPIASHGLRIGCYLALLAIQLTCILFTQSRGPWLGLMAGLLLFTLLLAVIQHKWKWSAIIAGMSVAVVLSVALISLPSSPFQFVRTMPYLSRMSQMFEASGRVRLLIWQGVTQLIAAEPKRAMIGYGPETMFMAMTPYYDPELRRLEGRIAFPDRSHNETFDLLASTGVIGCTLYLLLFAGLIYYGIKFLGLIRSGRQKNLFLSLCFTGGIGAVLFSYALDHSWRLAGVSLPLGMLAGVFAYLVGYGLKRLVAANAHNVETTDMPQRLIVIGLISALIAHFVEIQFGIAVVATRVSFWAYAGLLIAIVRTGFFKNISPADRSRPTDQKLIRWTSSPRWWIVRVGKIALVGGLSIVVLNFIVATNIDVIRADVLFKQGKVAFHQRGDYDQAIAFYRRALELQPDQDFYYFFLSKAQVDKGMAAQSIREHEALFGEAERSLERARDLNPLDVDHTANLARLHHLWARSSDESGQKAKHFQNAVSFYEHAIARCPKSVLLWQELGYTHFLIGHHERAHEKYRQALALDSTFTPVYLRLGEFYRAESKWKEAARSYEQVIAYNDTSIAAHSALGEMYARMSMIPEAVRENRRVLDFAPDNLITHTNLALLYQYIGKTGQALHHARKALANTAPEKRALLENFIAQLQRQSTTNHKLQITHSQ